VVGSYPALARAYEHCERLAREHYENFPVASRLVPAAMRPHIAAIYGFARRADDFADEPGIADAERMRLLDGWLANLRVAAAVNASAPTIALDQVGEGDELIFAALANTMRVHRLPVSLFEDLLSAFRQDVMTRRYRTWADVLDYCRRSANPVGRLVLRVAGCDDPRVDMASDAVCSALQLTNFWQDLGRDWNNGRLYVPLEDIAREGAREEDLARNCATAEWRAVMTTMVCRTRDLYAAGRSVCDAVRGRLRWELRLTWLGGSRILDKVEHLRLHSLRDRPTLNAGDLPALVRDAILWRLR
jgi:squalene synthase HpnC